MGGACGGPSRYRLATTKPDDGLPTWGTGTGGAGYALPPDEPKLRRWDKLTLASYGGEALLAVDVDTVLLRLRILSASGAGGPEDVGVADPLAPGEDPPENAAVLDGGPRGCLIGADAMRIRVVAKVCVL